MLDFTPQAGLPSSNVLRCLARRLASLSGYASSTSLINALLRALGFSGSCFVLRLMMLPLVSGDVASASGGYGRFGGQFRGGLADELLVDRLHDAVLHQHVLEFVHGDRRRDDALAGVVVDLRRQLPVLIRLLGFARELDHGHAAQF